MEWYASLLHVMCGSVQLICLARVRMKLALFAVEMGNSWSKHAHTHTYTQEKHLAKVVPLWVSENLTSIFKDNFSSISLSDLSLTDFKYDFNLEKFFPKDGISDLVSLGAQLAKDGLPQYDGMKSGDPEKMLQGISQGLINCIMCKQHNIVLSKRKKKTQEEEENGNGPP
jgi:hypothetical protein